MKLDNLREKICYILKIMKINVSISKTRFLLLTIIAILTSWLPSIQLILTEKIGNSIAAISNGYDIRNIVILLVFQSSILIIKIVLDFLSRVMENRLNTEVFFFMERSIKRKLLKIKMSMLEDSDTYNQIQIASSVAPQFGLNLFKNIILFIQTSISTILIIYILRDIPLIGLILLIFLSIINVIISRMFNKTQLNIYDLTSEQSRKRDQISSLLINRNIANEIRMYKVGEYFLNEWQKLFWKIENPQIKLTNKRTFLYNILLILTQCIQLAILIIEVTRSPENIVGTFLLITQAILLFQTHSSQLIESYNQINQISFYLPSYFKVMALPEEDTQLKPILFNGLDSKITVTNLSFKYKNVNQLALKNLNFEIYRGEKVAIVGYNGSGKTTLVKCLLGLYDNFEGSIQYDQTFVQDLDKDSFRRHVAVLLQHFGKYPLTLKENIIIGDFQKEIDNFKLKKSLELGNALTILQSLPSGIDTILSPEFEGGVDLSGGQWQKVGLARLYYRDPSIFFLDEPTSAIDPIAETKIYKDFFISSIGKTSIILTHRLGICKWVDKIIVMENGEIKEMGTHEDLLENGTVYKEMYKSQAEWYESSSNPSLSIYDCHA